MYTSLVPAPAGWRALVAHADGAWRVEDVAFFGMTEHGALEGVVGGPVLESIEDDPGFVRYISPSQFPTFYLPEVEAVAEHVRAYRAAPAAVTEAPTGASDPAAAA